MKNLEKQYKYLSVIIPVHNKENTLPRLLEALKVQQASKLNCEVIFIADGCTDTSLSILEEAQREQDFRIIETNFEQRGPSKARNLGIQAAQGLYCLFLDADILIPEDFLNVTIRHLEEFPDATYFAPVYGNSTSLSIWPLLVQDSNAVQTLNNSELLNWVREQKPLEDLRVSFVEKSDGWFDRLPAPWVFSWSSVMALKRETLLNLGGFNTSLQEKGSEDLELGYRLHQFRIRFRMMLDTYVFHLPHSRDRDREERTDRLQERHMLNMYRTREMEALCAFDGSHANAMIQCLEAINTEVVNKIQTYWETPINVKQLDIPDSIPLVIGVAPKWMTQTWSSIYVVNPCVDLSSQHLPLVGLALPFENQAFTSAVLVGLWQIMPERLACRIFDEAIRVAQQVYLLKHTQIPVEVISWSKDVLAIHDAPYWERTCTIHRSFWDFSLTRCGKDGCIESFHLI
jgi:glycosyltransferase involved in cell wall biosynthesis